MIFTSQIHYYAQDTGLYLGISLTINGIKLNSRSNLLILEVNSNFGVDDSVTVPYDAKAVWKGGPYYGQSPLAATRLADKYGYSLIYYDRGEHGILINFDIKMFKNIFY